MQRPIQLLRSPTSYEEFLEGACIEGGPENLKDLKSLVVGYVRYPHITEIDKPTTISNATIYLWKGLRDKHLKAVVLHEIAVPLGLGIPRYSRTPLYARHRSRGEAYTSHP